MQLYRTKYVVDGVVRQHWCVSKEDCAALRGALRRLHGKYDMAFEIEPVELPHRRRDLCALLNEVSSVDNGMLG